MYRHGVAAQLSRAVAERYGEGVVGRLGGHTPPGGDSKHSCEPAFGVAPRIDGKQSLGRLSGYLESPRGGYGTGVRVFVAHGMERTDHLGAGAGAALDVEVYRRYRLDDGREQ